MSGYSTKWHYLVLFTLAAVLSQACAPLTGGNSNGSSGNCQVSVTSNNGVEGIGQTGANPPPTTVTAINTDNIAQSFPANSATSFTTVILNIFAVFPTGQTPSSGLTLQVDVEPDSAVSTTGSSTPTTPAGPSSSLGTATVALSTMPTVTPNFVSFTFPASISLTVGQIYWVVATPNYNIGSTTYVAWAYATTQLLNQVAFYFQTITSSWISLGSTVNMDFKVGC